MQDIRCGNCNKKMGEGLFKSLRIKCPRCKVMNQLSDTSALPERHGASKKEPDDKSDSPLAGR